MRYRVDLSLRSYGADVPYWAGGRRPPRPRRAVLITGASGGVGHIAVQLARHVDAEIVESGVELAALVDAGEIRPEVDSVFPRTEARAAFERVAGPGKRGKVVLEVGTG